MANAERAEVVALDPLEMLLDAARYAEGNVGGGVILHGRKLPAPL